MLFVEAAVIGEDCSDASDRAVTITSEWLGRLLCGETPEVLTVSAAAWAAVFSKMDRQANIRPALVIL